MGSVYVWFGTMRSSTGAKSGSFTIRVVKGARKREFVYVIHIE